MATRPMTMMRPRSTFGGMRRPTRAPMIPPTKAPTPMRHDDEPVDVVAREEDEHRCGDEVDDERQDVLVAVEALQRLEAQGTEQAHEQHALGGAEVAAVDPGQEDPGGHGRRVPARRARPARRRSARGPGCAGRRRTRTNAMRMRTGTMARKAAAGRTSSSPAPTTEPTNDIGMSRRSVRPCPPSS